jgi:integrase
MKPKSGDNIYERKNKRGGAWYIKFSLNGVIVNKSFAWENAIADDRQAAFEDAVAWRNLEWQSITRKGVSIAETSQLTMRDLLKEYLAVETPKKKKSGAETETYRINHLLNSIDKALFKIVDTPIEGLGKDDFSDLSQQLITKGVSGWMVSGPKQKKNGKSPTRLKPAKPMKPDSANRYISLFSCVYKYALSKTKYEWIKENKALGHKIKVVHKRRPVPTTKDLEIILAETDSQYLKKALVLGFETGARLTEIMTLPWVDIGLELDLRKEIIPHIVFRDLKNKDDKKVVPLSPRARKLLTEFPEQDRYGYLFKNADAPSERIRPKSMSQAFKRARERAARTHGDDKYLSMVFHGSRGNFITKSAQIEGMSPLTLARLSGHKSLEVLLEHYYDPETRALAEALGFIKKRKTK